MNSQALLDVLLQLGRQRSGQLIILGKHHESLDQFSPLRIQLADHYRFNHGRVFQKRALDIERPDPVAE